MQEAVGLRIDIVSDIVCPWCIIGYKQVEMAIAMLDTAISPEFWWHPFELNPNMPPEGQDVGEHIMQKYGSTVEQSNVSRLRLREIGAGLGVNFSQSASRRIYNTFEAHKLLYVVGAEHGWRKQTELKLAMFLAYFEQDRDVSDEAVLLDIAQSIGLDRSANAAWLADASLGAKVRAEEAHWLDQNITGVPAIIFDEAFMVPGAQSAETFAGIISKVLAKRV
ncbi:MAG: DsbA family oxidoreductase [Sphingorhabdus sp.]